LRTRLPHGIRPFGGLSDTGPPNWTGLLTRNDLDSSGIVKGTGLIEAQFVVRRDGQVKFDKIKSASAEWESSFAGAVAIPKAAQNYPVMVQSLLAALYSDADLQSALR